MTDVPDAVRLVLEDDVTPRGIEWLVALWRDEGATTTAELVQRASAWLGDYNERTRYYR